MSFAHLVTSKGSIEICIIKYGLGFTSQIQTEQLHYGVVHYPIKVLQNDFTFQVKYRSQQEYYTAQSFITSASGLALATNVANNGYIRLYWPEFGLDYCGYIKSSKMGAEKFDIAPEMTYTMVCLKDSIYTPTLNFSSAPAFNAIYGSNIIDIDQALTVDSSGPTYSSVTLTGPDQANQAGPIQRQNAGKPPSNPFLPTTPGS